MKPHGRLVFVTLSVQSTSLSHFFVTNCSWMPLHSCTNQVCATMFDRRAGLLLERCGDRLVCIYGQYSR